MLKLSNLELLARFKTQIREEFEANIEAARKGEEDAKQAYLNYKNELEVKASLGQTP